MPRPMGGRTTQAAGIPPAQISAVAFWPDREAVEPRQSSKNQKSWMSPFSVFRTPTGTVATCSTTGPPPPAGGKPATGTPGFCSIGAAGPAPGADNSTYGNQCSAITFGNTQGGGAAACSVADPPGTGSCSVSSGQTGGNNNTQCSTFPPNGPSGTAGNATTATCSAYNPTTGAPTAGSNAACSVINPNGGGMIRGPTKNPTTGGTSCGGPYNGEGGVSPDPTTPTTSP